MSDTGVNMPQDDSVGARLLAEVESRYAAVEAAVAELRSAIAELRSYQDTAAQRQGEAALESVPTFGQAPSEETLAGEPESIASAPEEPAWSDAQRAGEPPFESAPAFGVAPGAMEMPLSEPESAAPAFEERVWPKASLEPADAGSQDDEARREDVARLVAEVQGEAADEPEAELPPQQQAEEQDDGSFVGVPYWPGPAAEASPLEAPEEDAGAPYDSTSEGSWPIANRAPASTTPDPDMGETPAAEPSMEEMAVESSQVEQPADDEEARREEVARIVAQMRGQDIAGVGLPDEAPADDDEIRAGWAADLDDSQVNVDESYDESTAGQDDDESRRQEVARMVAEMRGEADPDDEVPEDTAGDDSARRQAVAEMVARLRGGADLQGEQSPFGDEEDEDSDAREYAWPSLEGGRAEMAPGRTGEDDVEEPEAAARTEGPRASFPDSFPDWQNARVEPSGPPVIVIKDPEGRVELARVYETLSRAKCDENAALLNYTPHSVTVGLSASSPVPAAGDLSSIIEAVFGRKCRVDSDGVRVIIEIGKQSGGKEHVA